MLINSRDLYKSILGLTHPRLPKMQADLKAIGVTPLAQVGNNLLLDEAGAASLSAALTARKEAEAAPRQSPPTSRAASVPSELAASVESLKQSQETLLAEVAELSGTVDELHKSLIALKEGYDELVKGLPDHAKPNKVINLPTRYKWKIAIIGGDHRIREHAERHFPNVRFVQHEQGGQSAVRRDVNARAFPQADVAFHMVDFVGHATSEAARRFYGDKLTTIGGSGSSLVSAVRVWLHERERAA